jgi:predicted nucleic acid-binding protein
MIVVDASVIVDFVLGTPPYVDIVAEQLRAHAGDIHAPHLLDAEVGQVLRRFVLARDLSATRAASAAGYLEELPIYRHRHIGLVTAALRHATNLTVYDALYLVLAQGLGAALLTRDSAFKTPARRAGVQLNLVKGHGSRARR